VYKIANKEEVNMALKRILNNAAQEDQSTSSRS
jgi:hypothetical protein